MLFLGCNLYAHTNFSNEHSVFRLIFRVLTTESMIQTWLLPPSSEVLIMEAISTSETPIRLYQTTQFNNPEDQHRKARTGTGSGKV